MKSNKEVLRLLNEQYNIELQSSSLYTTHAGVSNIWGFFKLGDKFLEEAKEEREHADKTLRRILELDCTYPVSYVSKLPQNAPGSVVELFKQVEALESRTQTHLKELILTAEAAEDYITRDVGVGLLEPTEEVLVWIETQNKLISVIGLQNYLQAQI